MCAAGVLISDEEYDEEMEGQGILFVLAGFPKKLQELREHQTLISELQEIHDVNAPSNWSAMLEYLAYDYGIEIKWELK